MPSAECKTLGVFVTHSSGTVMPFYGGPGTLLKPIYSLMRNYYAERFVIVL